MNIVGINPNKVLLSLHPEHHNDVILDGEFLDFELNVFVKFPEFAVEFSLSEFLWERHWDVLLGFVEHQVNLHLEESGIARFFIPGMGQKVSDKILDFDNFFEIEWFDSAEELFVSEIIVKLVIKLIRTTEALLNRSALVGLPIWAPRRTQFCANQSRKVCLRP